jgi:hypothetical protein
MLGFGLSGPPLIVILIEFSLKTTKGLLFDLGAQYLLYAVGISRFSLSHLLDPIFYKVRMNAVFLIE